MQSFRLIEAFRKCGFLPIKKVEDEIRTNWANGWFLAINTVRWAVFALYMYFTILEIMETKMTAKLAIMIFARIMGSIGGSMCPLLLTLTAKRLGQEACNGMSTMPCLALLLISTVEMLFYSGAVLLQLPAFYTHSVLSTVLLASSEAILILIGVTDYFVTFSTTYMWTLDLKLKIKILLREYSKAQLGEFEDILKHYSDLKTAFEPLCFVIFPLVQILCIASIYLAVAG